MIILPHILTGLTTHCQKLRDHQVTFAKANHDDYTSEEGKIMAYRFNQCEIQPLFASVEDKSYGILLSSHCCFYCIKAQQSPELARDAGYCLARIESLTSEIYFVASFFLKTCVMAWRQLFLKKEGFKMSRCIRFKFKTDGIKDPSIKIIPHYSQEQCEVAMDPSRAEINSSEIDFWEEHSTLSNRNLIKTMKLKHEQNMYPPNVKMTIIKTSNHINKVPVKITGCSREGALDMDIPLARGFSPQDVSPFAENGSGQIILPDEKPEIKDAFKELLTVASDWKNIGTLLGMEPYVLDKISCDERGVNNQLRVMLSKWRSQCQPLPTWRALADGVAPIDPAKARSIKDRFATQ